MLTSLIAVLLLLVVGFYAVFIGAVGRASAGEMPMSVPRRLGVSGIGLAALGVAYLVYSHPNSLQSGAGVPKSWSATPSNPPEDRGNMASASGSGSSEPVLSASAVAEPSPAQSTAPTPTPVPMPVAASDAGDGQMSAAAAAMDAELLRRRQGLPALTEAPVGGEPVEAAPAAPASTPREPAPAVTPDVPARVATARPATRTTTARRPSTPKLGPAQPLTIVIRNELGERQQSERLSLLIEGKRVASFEVTDLMPVIELPIDLPRPGLLHYRLEGETVQGQRQTLRGQGCISATDGARFEVRRTPGSQRVFLESSRG